MPTEGTATSRQLVYVEAADDDLRQQFDALATRSYGHPIADITHLRPHADLQVATRDGRVIAGGLGLLVPQYFGGRPIPSACLAAGCVAPEERGQHLAADMVTQRLRALQEQGAVISAVSTSSNGYARTMGWEAPTQVFAWTIPAEDLKNSFPTGTIEIDHGLTPDALNLQHDLARHWNGPIHRPDWWTSWKQNKTNQTTYNAGSLS